jgi:hypothetical protein
MDRWDKEFIDLAEPGYIEFSDNGFGSFHFACVYANIDYRVNEQGKIEFSFYGDDEGQEVFGRGWAKIDKKGLYGGLFFHEGDDCEFQAAREISTKHKIEPFKRKNAINSVSNKMDLFA